MAVINRLNPQTRQLIRLLHNLIRELHFDFRENKNINIYISPGASDILYKIWSFCFHKLCIIILTKTTNNDPFYDTSITSDWRKRVLHPPVFARLIKVNHQLSVFSSGTFGQSMFQFIMITQTLLFNWIIQIVPYQRLLENAKNIRELLIESWGHEGQVFLRVLFCIKAGPWAKSPILTTFLATHRKQLDPELCPHTFFVSLAYFYFCLIFLKVVCAPLLSWDTSLGQS